MKFTTASELFSCWQSVTDSRYCIPRSFLLLLVIPELIIGDDHVVFSSFIQISTLQSTMLQPRLQGISTALPWHCWEAGFLQSAGTETIHHTKIWSTISHFQPSLRPPWCKLWPLRPNKLLRFDLKLYLKVLTWPLLELISLGPTSTNSWTIFQPFLPIICESNNLIIIHHCPFHLQPWLKLVQERRQPLPKRLHPKRLLLLLASLLDPRLPALLKIHIPSRTKGEFGANVFFFCNICAFFLTPRITYFETHFSAHFSSSVREISLLPKLHPCKSFVTLKFN